MIPQSDGNMLLTVMIIMHTVLQYLYNIPEKHISALNFKGLILSLTFWGVTPR